MKKDNKRGGSAERNARQYFFIEEDCFWGEKCKKMKRPNGSQPLGIIHLKSLYPCDLTVIVAAN